MQKMLWACAGALMIILTTGTSAWTALEISGRVTVDSYYYHQDKEGFSRDGYPAMKTHPGTGGIGGIPEGSTSAAEDRNQTYLDLNHSTHLRFHWMNEEGLGALTAFYANGDPMQVSATDAGFKVGVSIAVLYYYIAPNLRLSAGKGGSTQVFSPFDPHTIMGYDSVCKVEALGYGNINSKYQNNIRLTYNLTQSTGFDLALMMPRLTADKAAMGGVGLEAEEGTEVDNVSTLPKVEFAIPTTLGGGWGKLVFTPSAMYLKQEFSNVASGDDAVVSFGLSAGGTIEINGLKLAAEYTYGQNLPNAARSGEAQAFPFKWELIVGGLAEVMGARVYNSKIYDSETNAGWAQIGYNIADRVEPTFFYGRSNTKRDMPAADGYGDSDVTTQMYGVNMPIIVTENLKIVPEYMIYDNGDSNKINGTTYDFGQEWLAGLEFQLSF